MQRTRGLAAIMAITIGTAALFAQRGGDADSLPRRGWFGVALADQENGAVVTGVADGSTAAAEGIRAGDVIRAVDGRALRTSADVIAAIGRHPGGDTAVIDIVRDGREQRRTVVLRPFPRETVAGARFEYGSLSTGDGSRLRTLLSVPEKAQGRLPAVFLVQGGGCASVDLAVAPDVGLLGLIRTIAAQGFITMRVDKSGVGDSQGPPCDTIGYSQELAGYRAALDALRRHPSVDPGRVFVLGISLGGVFAPVLAREGPIRGVAVYGTLATPPPPYPGRSERFFKEFAAVDVAGAWADVNADVLALHGQFDEATSEADHAQIAAIVNRARAGRATHRELTGLDHCGTRHESLEKSRGNCGSGQASPELADAILAFLKSR